MKFREWDDIPNFMKKKEVKEYYDILSSKKATLSLKRGFDIVASLAMIIILFIPMIIIAIIIKVDSSGPVFYRQERVTMYGKKFRIHKFRTMVNDADRIGSTVTVKDDERITKIGKIIRNNRLDEIPQLLDVLIGNMTFVGTRPEATKYVKQYTNEMYATLLLPAGITSMASIRFKDENVLMEKANDVDKIYVKKILPQKMEWNLKSLKEFSIKNDIKTLFMTLYSIVNGKSDVRIR